MDELQAELRKLGLQASHIQHLIDHGPDEMGNEEDSDILSLREDCGEEVEQFGPAHGLVILLCCNPITAGPVQLLSG